MVTRVGLPIGLMVVLVVSLMLVSAQGVQAHRNDFGRILMGAAGAALLYGALEGGHHHHHYRHRAYRRSYWDDDYYYRRYPRTRFYYDYGWDYSPYGYGSGCW